MSGRHCTAELLWWRQARTIVTRVAMHPVVRVVVWSLVAATAVAAILAHELLAVGDRPRERALAVSVKDDPRWFDGCGKGGGRQTVLWRSENPPSGLPGEFEDAGCGYVRAGEHATLVRVVRGSGTDVVTEPTSSWGEVAQAWVVVFVICSLIGFLVTCAAVAWNRVRPRGRRRKETIPRHARPDRPRRPRSARRRS
jgi:hypothetical protein